VNQVAELARLGTATVYEAAGRRGLVDAPWIQVIPGSRAAGPARTVLCGQGDNLMMHAAMASVEPGDVLVVTMPELESVALMGDLLATQAKAQGAAAVLVDGAVRDVEELAQLGLPIWARFVSIRGATKDVVGSIDDAVTVGGLLIEPGDIVVLDADGVAAVPPDQVDSVLEASLERERREAQKRALLQEGALSYDLDGLRERVEQGGS
jgi:4-hydroxy-4-methyl-2-oxoglutarate aldolase